MAAAQNSPQTERVESPARVATLLVFPFENSSRVAKLDWLGEGLADLTIERLGGEGQFVFPREERLAALDRLGLPASTRYTRATMLKVAEEIDADYVVFGQYELNGRTLTVAARLLRISPASLSPPMVEPGALNDLMEMHGRLAWRVLRFINPAYPLNQRDFAAKFPKLRLDAFEYYVRGLLSLDDEERLRDFREAARLEPAWDAPAFALGHAYYGRHDCEAALPWLTRVPPAHERGAEANFEAGVCHLLRNDPARAEAAFAGLLESVRPAAPPAASARAEAAARPRELPEALNNLGVARERLGKRREAAAALERATQLDPEEAEYWFNLGLLRMRVNDASAAVRPFQEVLRRQPHDAEARALLIAALEKSGRSPEAEAERRESTSTGARAGTLPSLSPEALARMDRVRLRLDPASLHPLPESAAEAAPKPGDTLAHRLKHRQFHMTRGQEFLAAGQLDDAQREFNEAIVLAPLNTPAAHLGLAEVFRRQNRPDDAIRELRAALGSRDDSTTRTALARLLLGQNRIAEAREELRLALKLNPGYVEARQLLERLEARTGAGEPR